jgi:hypothetical protein
MRNEFTGDIMSIRAVEDCIRASRKYTECLFTKVNKHPEPIQGEEFPSRVLTKNYEVYPDVEAGWNMSIIDAAFWLADRPGHIDVRFSYSYTLNRGRVVIYGSDNVVQLLKDSVPNLEDALTKLCPNGVPPPPTTDVVGVDATTKRGVV